MNFFDVLIGNQLFLLIAIGVGVLASFFYYFLKLIKNRKKIMPPLGLDSLTTNLFIQLSDCRIHYQKVEQKVGKGKECLLLVHGLGASMYSWRWIAELLRNDFTTYIIDLPGFGKSSKSLDARYDLLSQSKRIIEFMDELKLPQVNLVGCSMGGSICLYSGVNHSTRFRSIIALSPSAHPRLVPPGYRLWKNLPHLFPLKANYPVVKRALLNVYADHALVTHETIQAYLRPYIEDEHTSKTFVRAIEAIRDPQMPGCLKSLNVPTLMLWGEKDRVVPLPLAHEILKVNPNILLKTHPQSGHHLPEEAPTWTAQQIQDFITKL